MTVIKINTIADGTAVQTPGDKLFPYLQANVDHVITVDDSELTLSFLDGIARESQDDRRELRTFNCSGLKAS